MPRYHLLCLVLCLVLVGCGGYSMNGNMTQTREPPSQLEDGVVIEGDELPVEVNRTFMRVEQLVGTNGSPPTVQVTKTEGRPPRTHLQAGEFSELFRMNKTYPAIDDAGGGTRDAVVEISYTENASSDSIERTLAHEFVHVLQPDDLDSMIRSDVDGQYRRTTDAKFARTSIVEGVAVFVADRYTEKYLEDARPYSSEFEANWEDWSVGLRTYWAPYYYGQRYVESRREAGRSLDDIYANPPRTAEQVLHNRTPDEEPRRQLAVNATTPDSAWDLTEEDTKGELYVRHLLEGELSTERAKWAAAGWGNDRLFTYYNVTKRGHVWVTRWDDAGEASEFEAALAEFLDRRYERNGTNWSGEEAAFRIESPTDDTVTFVAGNPSFPNATSVTANESGVNVETAE